MTRSPLTTRLARRDEGLAMASVLSVTAIAATLTVVAMTAASGTLRRSDRNETREQALHLAETAAARATTALAANSTYSTTTEVPPTPATRAWVLAQAAEATSIESGREGEYVWVVPSNADSVFGVGYVPSRASAVETRVLEVDVRLSNPYGDLSFLAAGSASIDGNVDISVGGSIHSNVDLTMSGNVSVDGMATASGAFSTTGNVSYGPGSGGAKLSYEVPIVDPRAHRHRTATDLCPDGTVRSPATDPCTGTVLATDSYNGWTWRSSDTRWRIASSTAPTGGYYVYHANVEISGNASLWNSTLVIEGQRVSGDLINGDFIMSGTTEIKPTSEGVAVVCSRDVVYSGNGKINGLVLAGEQVSLSGNAQVAGQIISATAASSAGSPVGQSQLSGNVNIKAQVHAPATTGGFAGTKWTEL